MTRLVLQAAQPIHIPLLLVTSVHTINDIAEGATLLLSSLNGYTRSVPNCGRCRKMGYLRLRKMLSDC